MNPQEASEAAAHITANATFTIGIIAALSAMMFSWVLPKIFEYNNNRNANILKELIEIRKSLTDEHEDSEQFDEIIAYRRKRYLKQQVILLQGLKDADDLEALEQWKDESWIENKTGISGTMFVLGIGSVVIIVAIGLTVGKWVFPI